MSLTRTEIRQRILELWPWLGYAATADAFGTTYVEHDLVFGNSGLGPDEYNGRYLYRYTLSGDDRVKQISTIDTSTGRATIDSNNNYSDTTTLTYEVLAAHPDIINNALQQAQRRQEMHSLALLTVGNDMDMEASGTAYWDGGTDGAVSSASVSKVTSAGNVPWGNQALFLNLSGAGGYTRSEKHRGNPGQAVRAYVILRVDQGTATVSFWDVDNSAAFGTAVSYSGEDFAVLVLEGSVPTNCRNFQVQIAGTGATDDIYIKGVAGPFQQGRRRFPLPSYLKENWSVKFLREAEFPIGLGSGAYDFASRQWVGDWQNTLDFVLENYPYEVEANHIQINEELPSWPMWILATRPLSDLEPLDSNTATTKAPEAQVMAYALHELATVFKAMRPGEQRYVDLEEQYRVESSIQAIQRHTQPVIPQRKITVVRA